MFPNPDETQDKGPSQNGKHDEPVARSAVTQIAGCANGDEKDGGAYYAEQDFGDVKS